MVVEWIPSLWKNSFTFSATWKIKWCVYEDLHYAELYLHVLGQVEAPDVGRGDDPVSSQLPDMEFMHCQDTIHLGHQLLLERVNLDVCWNCLKQNESRLNEERPDGAEDEHHQHDGEAGVHVVLVLPVSLPHDDSRDDDNYGSKSIGHHVQEHSWVKRY